jgi:hypothetical protein
MKAIVRYTGSLFADSYGILALGSFLVCVLSGIFLAVPYDMQRPYESVTLMVLGNSPANFFRNLHYWSGQFFLVFTILHTWDYLSGARKNETGHGVWLRLVVSLLVSVFVMLTGFLLKGDADSLQARRIVDSLISSVPLAGEFLSLSLLGEEGSLQLVYVHHIATATIFLFIVIFEHARIIWVKARPFVVISFILVVISLFFNAPLHDNLNPVVKGPWYLVGLQEALHWLKYPGWSLVVLLIVVLLVYFFPRWKGKRALLAKNLILGAFYLYCVLSLTAYFFRGENWQWIWPWDQGYREAVYFPFRPSLPFRQFDKEIMDLLVAGNRKESCMACHGGMQGFSPSHDPAALGCFVCHRGDPFSPDRKQAHRRMIMSPGNLADADLSCGTAECHPDIPGRVRLSLMSTLSGMVSVNRFVFGETDTPSFPSHIKHIGQSAADQHLRNLCAICHLGNRKTATGPYTHETFGGGCNACHLEYHGSALADHLHRLQPATPDTVLPRVHPSLSVRINAGHCFSCHSRSGRIATSYEGWHETLLEKGSLANPDGFRILEDGRVFSYVQEDVHHAAGLDCIDCHTSYGLMGDGNTYLHKEEQVKVMCEDCHFTGPARTVSFGELDRETAKIAGLRYPDPATRSYIRGNRSGVFLVNTYEQESRAYLEGKNTGKIHPMNPPAPICKNGKAHETLSCSACHSGWAPRCIGCHNEYDPLAPGYDMIKNRHRKGTWVEYTGLHLAMAPGLGVRESSGSNDRRILPSTPGMILTIDKSSYTGKEQPVLFRRLFAPVEPHTTMPEGRSCRSCHNDPVALGFGEGRLEYHTGPVSGKWVFIPRFSDNIHDGLPEDAWTGFLENPVQPFSTRGNFRPFNTEEQKRILTVGACLVCHEEDSEAMLESLHDFQKVWENRKKTCVTPAWDK